MDIQRLLIIFIFSLSGMYFGSAINIKETLDNSTITVSKPNRSGKPIHLHHQLQAIASTPTTAALNPVKIELLHQLQIVLRVSNNI